MKKTKKYFVIFFYSYGCLKKCGYGDKGFYVGDGVDGSLAGTQSAVLHGKAMMWLF